MGTKAEFNCAHEKVGKKVMLTLEEINHIAGSRPGFMLDNP